MAKGDFGGYGIDFTGRQETAEAIFGKEKITPAEMNKRLWAYIKKHGLAVKAAK